MSRIRPRPCRPATCSSPSSIGSASARTASGTAKGSWRRFERKAHDPKRQTENGKRKRRTMKRIVLSVGTGVAALLVWTTGFAAGKSDVADAAMRGDKAAVRTLIGQHADVNAPQ